MDVEGKGVLGTAAVEVEDNSFIRGNKERADVEAVGLEAEHVPVSRKRRKSDEYGIDTTESTDFA